MIYFDNSSTTSVRAEVSRIYAQLIKEAYANPDAMHTPGREVSKMMETSRKKIAEMLKLLMKKCCLLPAPVNPIHWLSLVTVWLIHIEESTFFYPMRNMPV